MNHTTHNSQPTTRLRHIAIIMDGNRRWAKQHRLPVLEGHRRVVDNILIPLVKHAAERKIEYITFWAWSTENWRRKAEEVSGIMGLFRHVIARRWQELHENGVRITIIGNTTQFDLDIRESLEKVVDQTKMNKKITAVFALNYGGRDEIIRSMQRYQQTDNQLLTTDNFSKYLDTAGIPDPDLIVRTGGEQRLSGFLLWQSEYSELYFPEWYMPEFTNERLDECIEEFVNRKRNFGI